MQTTQKQHTYDVIIAGAGPVGLFLACELALAKCSVLILEKAEAPASPLKQLPFGIRGLSAPSIESLYRRGLLSRLEVHQKLKNPHQNARQGAERQVGHFAGIPFTEGNVDTSRWGHRLAGSPEVSMLTTMHEMETVLSRRAESLGVEMRRGVALAGFEQDDSGVTVSWADGSFNGKWLVGCDGARSVVRKLAGFEFAGTEPEFTGYSASVDIADPEKLKPGRNVTPQGMYLQSQPGFVVIQDFDGGAFHAAEQPITLQHVQEVLRRVSGTDVSITALHMAATWTDRARQATHYRMGRVLLAGDAAHIHSPLGGQGLNLGLGDAMNLGWKLAATIRGTAPKGLLDTYDAERYPVGMKVLDWSRAQVAIMKPDAWSRALHAILSDVINTRDGATYFAARVWGIHTRYNLGGNQPLSGCSVPNFELANGTKVGELMHGGQGILLDFEGDESFKALAADYNHQLNYVPGLARAQLGLSALLIRPDGIIAWSSNGKPDCVELQKAADRWFVRV